MESTPQPATAIYKIEALAYLYIAVMYSAMNGWILYRLIFQQAHLTHSDRVVFYACTPVYIALTLMVYVAAFRTAHGKKGRYENILLVILAPFVLGMSVAPAYLMYVAIVTFSWLFVAALVAIAAFFVAYLILVVRYFRQSLMSEHVSRR